MKHRFLSLLLSSLVIGSSANALANPRPGPATGPAPVHPDCVVIPDPTNAVQFRLYTDASPEAPHLFNTFDLGAYGATLLQSPGRQEVTPWPAAPLSNTWLHSILVNGQGPELASANSMTVIQRVSGPEWRYVALDVTPAYRERLQQFKRGILFVEPDLFVLYDHLVGREPVDFQMLLHPPAATSLDTNWGDLRLALPKAGCRINTPGRKGELRSWKHIASPADVAFPGTVTMELSPATKLATLDVLTVFAVYRGGDRISYAFKLLESNTAIGARIHRQGLPTLVAFKTDPEAASASLTGFGFSGPVGVAVFKPKLKAR